MKNKLSDKDKIKQKIALLELRSSKEKSELGDELLVVKDKLGSIGKIALGIGGGLVLSAIILKRLKGPNNKSKSKRRSRRVYQRFLDQLAIEISAYMVDFAIELAKSKLQNLANKNITTEDNDPEFIVREEE